MFDEGIDGLWSGPISSSSEDGCVNHSIGVADATGAPWTLVLVERRLVILEPSRVAP